MAVKVLEINKNIFASHEEAAAMVRQENLKNRTFMVNLMASPGAGKTTTLLRTVEALSGKYRIGVMEADIEAVVDAETMEKAGVRSIEIHTGGECAMTAEMTLQGIREFHTEDLDLLFLENVGNLVCPAEEDTGADINVAILSVPEGDDKPLKYPLMFEVCQVILINKIDTKAYFDFDEEAVTERIRRLNPKAEIFFVSAKTGQGFPAWTKWLREQADAKIKG